MHQQTTVTWLKAASAIVIAFGLIGVLGAYPATSGFARIMADLAFWPVDGTPAAVSADGRLLWAISSGVLAGWGAMIWMIAGQLYPREPTLARSMILTGVFTWFVIDSIGSVLAGAPMNVLFNVGFLALFTIPLMKPAREAHG